MMSDQSQLSFFERLDGLPRQPFYTQYDRSLFETLGIILLLALSFRPLRQAGFVRLVGLRTRLSQDQWTVEGSDADPDPCESQADDHKKKDRRRFDFGHEHG